ncbi:RicAFT regulatory complex protein RicA family protein [Thermoactinomyces mirandus]|uniref:YlbF family regulator n=1 Tax=Thermoactinomyces mirandus TaxID=2756294 RepID=A0A7W2AQW1_9BACL|nr:YlbF family regulator [Thermoactinomyces mirandus]MBA4602359.1 YlbF family regulator [Thermoactinomyces mirandus]
MEPIPENHPVLKRARQFAELIQESEEIKRFRAAEQQVQNSETVQKRIDVIRHKQKEWVVARHYQKTEYARLLEKELDQLNHELESLPIVREYQQSQVDINDLLQIIQQVIASTVSQKISVVTGGKMDHKCGNCGHRGCSC